jgi:ribosomal protein S20
VVTLDPRTDEPAIVENLDFAEKLREQARRMRLKMSEAYSRAKSAQKKGSSGAAQEHRQRADALKSAFKKLDKQAAEIIFKEKNKALHVPRYVFKVVP